MEKNDEIMNPDYSRTLTAEDTAFVNKDGKSFAYDQKILTKPTTFAKDAFKRFCKNKSSVVGAIIIGVLLLASFITPFVSPYSNLPSSILTSQSLLEPKLFNAGTGFWDGCKTYKNQVYNRITELPEGGPDSQGFKKDPILKLTLSDIEYINYYSEFAWDGLNSMTADDVFIEGYNPEDYLIYTYNKEGVAMSKDNGLQLVVTLDHTDGINGNLVADEYRAFIYKKDIEDSRVREEYIPLTNGWVNYPNDNKFVFDISNVIKNSGKEDLVSGDVMFEAKPKVSTREANKRTYMLIKSMVYTSSNGDEAFKDRLNAISYKDRSVEEIKEGEKKGLILGDANAASHYTKGDIGYWPSNGKRVPYNAKARFADVYYDLYEHVFGKRSMVVGQSIMQEYLDKGWCSFVGSTNKLTDYNETNPLDLNKYPFKVLDANNCPVVSVSSIDFTKDGDSGFFQFETETIFYKYCGLNSVPRYIFGTDANGRDMLTISLTCLKNSLLVAIIASLICLVIGLIWGSISGYFGGTVDLIMERIVEIVSGIPWIVMMTLIILLLGQKVVTFGIALVLTGWIATATRTRTQFYRFRDREYVLASRTLGASDARLIFKHILPNSLGTIVTSSVLMIPTCIFSEATLSYLGLGLKGVDSFGVLLSNNQQYLQTFPMLVIWPSIIISLLMISFNLFGNGLRDALNPTLKGGEQ